MFTLIAEDIRRWLAEIVIVYLIVVAGGLTVSVGVVLFAKLYFRFRGPKQIMCPETGSAAVVEIDALHATLGELLGDPDIHLLNCSRWKDRPPCPPATWRRSCVVIKPSTFESGAIGYSALRAAVDGPTHSSSGRLLHPLRIWKCQGTVTV